MTLQIYNYTDEELKNIMKQVQNNGHKIFTEQNCNKAQLTNIF